VAVTGTLAYDLEQAGIVNLDNRTDTIVPGLGTQHNHTVRQLLQNSGCVKHYTTDAFDDNDTQVLYPTEQSALISHRENDLRQPDPDPDCRSAGPRDAAGRNSRLSQFIRRAPDDQ
jgi:hypothetical protein